MVAFYREEQGSVVYKRVRQYVCIWESALTRTLVPVVCGVDGLAARIQVRGDYTKNDGQYRPRDSSRDVTYSCAR